MKQILLLVAIYSLIIHQSHKNAKGKITAGKNLITTAILLQMNTNKKQIASPNIKNAGYVSISNKNEGNDNSYIKWINKEQ